MSIFTNIIHYLSGKSRSVGRAQFQPTFIRRSGQVNHDVAIHRRERLFALFQSTLYSGGKILPVGMVDQYCTQRTGAFFLKHDVHDLDLDSLIGFAREESRLGIGATFFFMPNKHPRTIKAYGFAEQVDAMREIAAMGHELALHIDPYFQMHQRQVSLRDAMKEILDEFSQHGIELHIGNMHGNSHFKHPDKDGYGTSFDLFEEVGRQQDFPQLASVASESAGLIRKNRISLEEFGFTHWADMPLWSARHGFVGTNFVTDNRLGKEGTLELLTREKTTGAYYLHTRQPPGSRNLMTGGQRVAVKNSVQSKMTYNQQNLDFFGDELLSRLSSPRTIGPVVILMHPEFYC